MKPHAQSLTGFAAFLFNEGVVLVETHPSSLLIMGLVTLLVSTYSLAFYIIYYFAAILGCWVILAVYSNFPLYLSTSSKKGIILGINSTESGGEGVVVGGGVGGKAIGGPDQKSSTSESAPFSSIKSPYSSRPFLWKSWLEKRQRERVVLVSRPFLDSKRVQKLIDDLLALISRDFVKSWYPAISAEPVFVQSVESSLRHIAKGLCERLNSIDQKRFLVERAGPILLMHFQEYRKAERLWKGYRLQRSGNISTTDEIDYELARCYMGGNLHPAVSAKSISPQSTLSTENSHLRRLAENILVILGPPNEIQSRAVLVLFREILTCRVLQPVLEMFSDPDYWNQTIESLTERMTEDKTIISQLKDSIGSETSAAATATGGSGGLGGDDLASSSNTSNSIQHPRSAAAGVMSDGSLFNEFITQIKDCKNLLEAYQMRDAVHQELLSVKTPQPQSVIGGVMAPEYGPDFSVYSLNLENALNLLDRQIQLLSNREKRRNSSPTQDAALAIPFDMMIKETLFLSYFAEFLERGHRRNLIHLWVTIETIRQDSLLTREEELKSLSQRPLSGVDFVGGVFLQITVQEAVDIYETYFVSPAGSFHIDLTPNTRATLDSIMAKFLNRNQDLHYPPHQLQPPIYPSGILNEVDSSCFLVVQEEICDLMSRQDYPLFLKSTFYARFLQDKNGSNKHWQIMKSGKTESYPSQHHQSPPFQQDQVSPNRLSALSSASENLSTALPSSFVKNKPNMAELSSSSSSNLKHLVAPETTHVERTSFDADQSGAETDWAAEDALTRTNSAKKKRKSVFDTFKRNRTSSVNSTSNAAPATTSASSPLPLASDHSPPPSSPLPPSDGDHQLDTSGIASISPTKSPLKKLFGYSPQKASRVATVDDIIDTVSPSLQQQHQQQPFTAVRRLSKDFDYEPPIAESSGDDADHHRPSGLSFKFLKKGSAVSKYSKRSMNVSSDSLNFRSNPDLSSGQEAGTFGASGSSAFVTHLKDEDSTHHSNSELSNTLATSMANRKTKLGKVFAGSLFGKGGGESSQSSLNSLKRGDLVSRSTHSLADSAKSIDRNPRARAAVFGSGTHKSMESLQDLNNTRRSSFEQSDEEDAGKSRSSMDSLRITRSLVPPPPSLHQQQLSIVTSERKELTQPLGEARATSTSPVLPPPPPPPIGSGVSASSEEKSPDSLNLFSNTTAILPEVSLLGSIIPPTYEINAKRDLIERLQKERFEIRDQLKQVERAGFGSYSKDKQRNLQLMNTGLKVELDGLFKERRALELQVLENIISESTSISIPDYEINQDGKEYAAYTIRVQQESPSSEYYEWTVARRYSEFFELHQQLKMQFGFAIMNQYELPSKVPFLKIKKDLIMTRKVALERYLEKLAKNPDMCKSREFLHFICSDEIYRLVEQHVFNSGSNEDLEAASGGGKGMRFVKNILTNVDESMDGFIQKFKLSSQGGGSGNIGGVTSSAVSTALGMMNPNNVWLNIKATTMGRNNRSPVGGNLISSTARDGQSLSATGGGGGGVMFGAPSLQQNGSQYSSEGGGGGAGLAADADAEIEVTSTDIIVDIFQEVFQLKEKNNWLRRGAVLLIVQQLFGGTVDRRVTEQVKWVFSRENVIYVLERIKESLWPGGKWWSSSAAEGQQKQQQQPPAPRTIEEKLRSKLKAKGNVVQLVPELLGGVVGRQNAKRGAERLFFILQNRRLNQHLIYKLFDELSAQLMA